MKSRVAVVSFVLIISGSLDASNDTVPLLEAPNVGRFVRLQVSADGKTLRFAFKDQADFLELPASRTLLSTSKVSVRLADYNPLQVTVSTNTTTEADPNYKALDDFLSSLEALGKQVVPTAPKAPGVAAVDTAKDSPCEAAGHSIQRILTGPAPLTSQKLGKWVKGSAGLSGILTQLGESNSSDGGTVRGTLTTVKSSTKELDADIALLEKWFRQQQACTFTNDSDLQARITGLYLLAQQALPPLKGIATQLSTLEERLVSFSTDTKWFDSDRTTKSDYELLVSPDPFKNKITLHLDVQGRTYTLSEAGALTIKESDKMSWDIYLRYYSLFVPEVAAGVLYNEVKYPQYGTAVVNGKTTVAPASTGSGHIDAALMTNIVFRGLEMRWLYPMAQIGVSTAKDFPGILGGLGLRFWRLSISVGRMVTWSKDLDHLKVGDEVTGTAQIDSDLKLTRAPTAWYGAIQYSF